VAYAASQGVRTPLLWTASLLEARLYSERRDLLFAYFGISTTGEARALESRIVRNVGLKKQLHRELLKDWGKIDREKARLRPYAKFLHTEFIIHSVDDNSYPNVDVSHGGISGWFKLEVWDFRFDGLEFVLGIDRGIVDEDGNWAVIHHGDRIDEKAYREIKMFHLARIPYENIVDLDLEGDEYYPQPHIYCRFANGG